MLIDQHKQQLLNEFPKIKLSYENITHKKVLNYDFISATPEGTKHFAWFTTIDSKNVCVLMQLGEDKKITNIYIKSCSYDAELSYGTILYGTLFIHDKTTFFTMEDIHYYKGNNISNYTWSEKLTQFYNIMNHDINQVAYNNSFIVFGLPVMSNNFNDLIEKIYKLNYKIHFLQFRMLHIKNISNLTLFKYPINKVCLKEDATHVNINKNSNTQIHKPLNVRDAPLNVKAIVNNNVTHTIVFKIKPDIQNDIYHLFCDKDGNDSYYDVAYIPDFVTSVMMNKLFRNIKENYNLDALEESDDEEEFENNDQNRFVSLDKSYRMVCVYNYKFKKWCPKNIANENMKIVSKSQLLQMETQNTKYKKHIF